MTRPQPTPFEGELDQRLAVLAGLVSDLALLEPVSQAPGAQVHYTSASRPAISVAFIIDNALPRHITVPARQGE